MDESFLAHVLTTYRSNNGESKCMSHDYACLQSTFEVIAEVVGEKLARKLWKEEGLPISRSKKDKIKMFKENQRRHANVGIEVQKCDMCLGQGPNNIEKKLELKVSIQNMSNYIKYINIGDVVELKLKLSLKSISGVGFCFSINQAHFVTSYKDGTTQYNNLGKRFLWTPLLAGARLWIGSNYKPNTNTGAEGTHDVTGLLHYAIENILAYKVAWNESGTQWYALTEYDPMEKDFHP